MNEHLANGPAHRPNAVHRRRASRRLARQDRVSARLAQLHGRAEALAGAQAAIELGWARTARCVGCGGTDPAGCCLVCAFAMGRDLHRGRLDRGALAAQDVTWRTLHRNRTRPVHWNAASVSSDLQASELSRWNDSAAVTGVQVAALLQTARARAERALDQARLAAAHLALA